MMPLSAFIWSRPCGHMLSLLWTCCLKFYMQPLPRVNIELLLNSHPYRYFHIVNHNAKMNTRRRDLLRRGKKSTCIHLPADYILWRWFVEGGMLFLLSRFSSSYSHDIVKNSPSLLYFWTEIDSGYDEKRYTTSRMALYCRSIMNAILKKAMFMVGTYIYFFKTLCPTNRRTDSLNLHNISNMLAEKWRGMMSPCL